jgi:urease accessory protein
MASTPIEPLAQLRLLQLVSPTLPVGAFAYSQGLEWAREAGWVSDAQGLEDWLEGLVESELTGVDIPLLARLYRACEDDDREALAHWTDWLLACRGTRELRAEEANRGRALAALLVDLDVEGTAQARPLLERTQLAGLALAAQRWAIPLEATALGHAWSWLENLTTAAVKAIPLGQTAGQRTLLRLAARLPEAVATGVALDDDALGASAPALAIASSRHEGQYTRLFRS